MQKSNYNMYYSITYTITYHMKDGTTKVVEYKVYHSETSKPFKEFWNLESVKSHTS